MKCDLPKGADPLLLILISVFKVEEDKFQYVNPYNKLDMILAVCADEDSPNSCVDRVKPRKQTSLITTKPV